MARETVAEEPDPGGGTYRLEMIRCGKPACNSCPHGPYWYRYYRVGKRVVSKYVGRDRGGAITTQAAADDTTQGAGTEPLVSSAPEGPSSAMTLQETGHEIPRPDAIHAQVRNAVRALMLGDPDDPRLAGEFVSITDLRRMLPNISREELDAELDRLYRNQHVNLVPQSSPRLLTMEDREASIRVGGQEKNLISIPATPPDGLPADQPAAPRSGETPLDKVRQKLQAITDEKATAKPSPAPVKMSDRPLTPNRWGTFAASAYPINFHKDGMIGIAIDRMGQDAMLEIDGEPLADHLGRAATDAVVGRASSQEVLERVKQLRDHLPQGSAARWELDEAVRKLDAPDTPVPAVPNGAPAPLRQLMTDLHAVPLVRRDPSREEDALARILADFAAGKTGGARLLLAVRSLKNKRHESVEGKFEVDRAVERAVDALEAMRRADRRGLYPPGS